MSASHRARASRITYGIFLLVVLLLGGLAVAFLSIQSTGMTSPDDIRQIDPRPTAGLRLTTTDSSDRWSWNWAASSCTAAFTEWLAPQELQHLELRLVDPQDHDLNLPLRARYQSAAGQTATAGAWCEPASQRQAAKLICLVAPLEASDPSAATTALTGAVAQAVTYVLDPHVFGEAQGRPWAWSQWQPLVSAAAGDWHSACPILSAEASHD